MPKKNYKSSHRSEDDLRKKNQSLRLALAHLLIKLGLGADEGELSDEYLINQAERYDPRRDDYYGRYREGEKVRNLSGEEEEPPF